jgi:hypothetical protein
VDSAVEAEGSVGGFRAFIPWTYQAENNHLKGRTQATTMEYLRFITVSRLFFDNVAHLQASWLTTGKDVGQLALHLGVDDLGSIMLEENVISSAGARHRSNLHELIWMIRTAGRIPAQRDTLYRHLAVHATEADDPTDERVVSHFSSIAMPGGGAPARSFWSDSGELPTCGRYEAVATLVIAASPAVQLESAVRMSGAPPARVLCALHFGHKAAVPTGLMTISIFRVAHHERRS